MNSSFSNILRRKNPFKFLVSKLDRVRQEKAIKLLMTALALDETIRLSTSIVSAQATQTIAEVLSHVNRSVIKLVTRLMMRR